MLWRERRTDQGLPAHRAVQPQQRPARAWAAPDRLWPRRSWSRGALEATGRWAARRRGAPATPSWGSAAPLYAISCDKPQFQLAAASRNNSEQVSAPLLKTASVFTAHSSKSSQIARYNMAYEEDDLESGMSIRVNH